MYDSKYVIFRLQSEESSVCFRLFYDKNAVCRLFYDKDAVSRLFYDKLAFLVCSRCFRATRPKMLNKSAWSPFPKPSNPATRRRTKRVGAGVVGGNQNGYENTNIGPE